MNLEYMPHLCSIEHSSIIAIHWFNTQSGRSFRNGINRPINLNAYDTKIDAIHCEEYNAGYPINTTAVAVVFNVNYPYNNANIIAVSGNESIDTVYDDAAHLLFQNDISTTNPSNSNTSRIQLSQRHIHSITNTFNTYEYDLKSQQMMIVFQLLNDEISAQALQCFISNTTVVYADEYDMDSDKNEMTFLNFQCKTHAINSFNDFDPQCNNSMSVDATYTSEHTHMLQSISLMTRYYFILLGIYVITIKAINMKISKLDIFNQHELLPHGVADNSVPCADEIMLSMPRTIKTSLSSHFNSSITKHTIHKSRQQLMTWMQCIVLLLLYLATFNSTRTNQTNPSLATVDYMSFTLD